MRVSRGLRQWDRATMGAGKSRTPGPIPPAQAETRPTHQPQPGAELLKAPCGHPDPVLCQGRGVQGIPGASLFFLVLATHPVPKPAPASSSDTLGISEWRKEQQRVGPGQVLSRHTGGCSWKLIQGKLLES